MSLIVKGNAVLDLKAVPIRWAQALILGIAISIGGGAVSVAQSGYVHTPKKVCEGAALVLLKDDDAGEEISASDREWIDDFVDMGEMEECEHPPRHLLLEMLTLSNPRNDSDKLMIDQTIDFLKKTQAATEYVPMALALIDGRFGTVAPEIGVQLLEYGVEIGDPEALREQGGLYETGALGYPQDKAKALALTRQAAELGGSTAMYAMGVRYFHGNEVKRDWKTAEDWLVKAAEHGSVDAVAVLASAYAGTADARSYGIKPNPKEGRRYALIAANAGDTNSMALYASYLLKDKKSFKHEDEVFYWLNKAADDGDETVAAVLAQVGPELRESYAESRRNRAAITKPPLFSCKPVTRCLVYRNPGVVGSQKICAPAPNYRYCSVN